MSTTIRHQSEHNLDTTSTTILEYDSSSASTNFNKEKKNKNSFSKLRISKEGKEFANYFKNLLPPVQKVTDDRMIDWAKTYDKLVRIDKKPRYEIYAVTTWALLHDDFLRKQGIRFSPSTLRQRNKEGITYYDVFLQGYVRNPEETTEILRQGIFC